jgi:hypothetical protein
MIATKHKILKAVMIRIDFSDLVGILDELHN